MKCVSDVNPDDFLTKDVVKTLESILLRIDITLFEGYSFLIAVEGLLF